MAPKQFKEWKKVNGKWVKNAKATNDKGNKWWEGEGEDWACIHCDTQASPFYQGNYASDTSCRECLKPKGTSHHMKMSTRKWRLDNGTLKTRDEMVNLREERTNKKKHPNMIRPTQRPSTQQGQGKTGMKKCAGNGRWA